MLLMLNTPTWTGSLPTWLILVFAFIVAWRISRGGGGTAVTELTAANKYLTEENEKSKLRAEAQAKQIAALESKTDVVLAVSPLIAEHERRASERHTKMLEMFQERSDATVHALEAISEKLSLISK